MKCSTKESYELFHKGTLAFADIEANGIRMDVEALDNAIHFVGTKTNSLERKIAKSKVYRKWKESYSNPDLYSGPQLGDVLFNQMGYESKHFTRTGKASTTKEHLKEIDHPFVRRLLRWRKYDKLKSTYLFQFKRELVGDRFHPIINLHLARTHRSSIDHPSFQNLPVRNKELAQIIRRCFIPRKGCIWGSFDFKAIEVNVSGFYHKDPRWLAYCRDSSKDMHRDMAMECYILKQSQVNDVVRYCAKNKYVFPQMYGSYYVDCARALWEAIDELKLTTVKGTPLKEHLKKYGITRMGKCSKNSDSQPEEGTFEFHIKEVEDRYWNERFPVYNQWKKDRYSDYLETGRFDLLTGFMIEGIYKRNKVISYAIQGAAFHCLLWVLTELHYWLKKNRMRTMIIGQIHDSLETDIHPDELEDVLAHIKWLVEVGLARHWPWIITPMKVEAKLSTIGGNWYDQTKVEL